MKTAFYPPSSAHKAENALGEGRVRAPKAVFSIVYTIHFIMAMGFFWETQAEGITGSAKRHIPGL